MEFVFQPLSIVLIVTTLETEAAFKISNIFKDDIIITITQDAVDGTVALVPGAEQCGGLGTFDELRYPCASDSDICEVHGDNEARVAQLAFTAGDTVTNLGAKIKIKADGSEEETVLFNKAIDSMGIMNGQYYVAKIYLSAQSHSVGQKVTVTTELYDADTPTSKQLCVKADFKIIK